MYKLGFCIYGPAVSACSAYVCVFGWVAVCKTVIVCSPLQPTVPDQPCYAPPHPCFAVPLQAHAAAGAAARPRVAGGLQAS